MAQIISSDLLKTIITTMQSTLDGATNKNINSSAWQQRLPTVVTSSVFDFLHCRARFAVAHVCRSWYQLSAQAGITGIVLDEFACPTRMMAIELLGNKRINKLQYFTSPELSGMELEYVARRLKTIAHLNVEIMGSRDISSFEHFHRLRSVKVSYVRESRNTHMLPWPSSKTLESLDFEIRVKRDNLAHENVHDWIEFTLAAMPALRVLHLTGAICFRAGASWSPRTLTDVKMMTDPLRMMLTDGDAGVDELLRGGISNGGGSGDGGGGGGGNGNADPHCIGGATLLQSLTVLNVDCARALGVIGACTSLTHLTIGLGIINPDNRWAAVWTPLSALDKLLFLRLPLGNVDKPETIQGLEKLNSSLRTFDFALGVTRLLGNVIYPLVMAWTAVDRITIRNISIDRHELLTLLRQSQSETVVAFPNTHDRMDGIMESLAAAGSGDTANNDDDDDGDGNDGGDAIPSASHAPLLKEDGDEPNGDGDDYVDDYIQAMITTRDYDELSYVTGTWKWSR